MVESKNPRPLPVPADRSSSSRRSKFTSAYKTDTIVSLATPPGISGVAVIRLSGPESLQMAGRLCNAPLAAQPRHAFFAQLIHPADQVVIDSAIVTYFKGPASFTGEDVVEISTHGGYVNQRQVIDALQETGARQAEAGEFTLRAYLNGKLDLAEAEGLHLQILSMSPRTQQAARQNAGGRLSRQIDDIRQRLIRIITIIEHELDFSESEISPTTTAEVSSELGLALSALRKIDATGPFGKMLRDGIKVVLAGAPNAGKSSLFNALVGREQAIVTDHPGTTRDSLEGWINMDGFPVCLIDTAGLNEATDPIERIGIVRSISAIEQADIVLALDPVDPGKVELPALLQDRPVIYLRSKADEATAAPPADTIDTSIMTDNGLDDLHTALVAALRQFVPAAESAIVSSDRQSRGIDEALKQLARTQTALHEGQPYDLIAADARIAIDALAAVIGDIPQEEILGEIFGQFCVGK